jgi:shikimate kinase
MANLTKKLTKPIVFVGLMGAGKTSVGGFVAKKLNLPFYDSDIEVEKTAGCSVSDIFSIYGEKEFRRVEQAIIKKILGGDDLKILSTGEGAFTIPKVRKIIKEKAISVWIKAELDLLVKRTSIKDTRPLLKKDNPRQILEKLIQQRYDIYSQADITINTSDEPTYKTVRKVLKTIDYYIKHK